MDSDHDALYEDPRDQVPPSKKPLPHNGDAPRHTAVAALWRSPASPPAQGSGIQHDPIDLDFNSPVFTATENQMTPRRRNVVMRSWKDHEERLRKETSTEPKSTPEPADTETATPSRRQSASSFLQGLKARGTTKYIYYGGGAGTMVAMISMNILTWYIL